MNFKRTMHCIMPSRPGNIVSYQQSMCSDVHSRQTCWGDRLWSLHLWQVLCSKWLAWRSRSKFDICKVSEVQNVWHSA
jgi:hypothetical protein